MPQRILKNEIFLQALLVVLFLVAALPGVEWGTPNLWNPDELVWRAAQALNGEMVFDQTEPDYNYPSLPKYVMYGVGKMTYALGYSRADFIIAARGVSALLGALVAALVYRLTRWSGGGARAAFLAGVFYIASGVSAANARFAHNDLYLQFFAVLCVYFSVQYSQTRARGWLYVSFIAAGFAACSKYTGASLILAPFAAFIFSNWAEVRRRYFLAFQTALLGAALFYGGYALGAPRALLAPIDYFSRVIPAALNFSRYGFNSAAPLGVFGQWAVFRSALGSFIYGLFLIGFVWNAARLFLRAGGLPPIEEKRRRASWVLLFTLIVFDLPYLISINYIPRHFIPFTPFMALLSVLFVEDVFAALPRLSWRYAFALFLAAGVFYSALRLASVALLFLHDARIPASAYIESIADKNKIIEYTLYPPNVERKKFKKAYNYPIYFVKYQTDVVPSGGRYEYNSGEAGLLKRETDYLVIDSLTYARFATPSVCATNPLECDLFQKLLADESSSFRLIKTFSYSLPPYLPSVSIAAVNPQIKIYQRVK